MWLPDSEGGGDCGGKLWQPPGIWDVYFFVCSWQLRRAWQMVQVFVTGIYYHWIILLVAVATVGAAATMDATTDGCNLLTSLLSFLWLGEK